MATTTITAGNTWHEVKLEKVVVTSGAAELGVTPAALHQQVRAGRLPAFMMRNAAFVTADIARQVREWFPANRFKPWPTCTETLSTDERPDADEPVPDSGVDPTRG